MTHKIIPIFSAFLLAFLSGCAAQTEQSVPENAAFCDDITKHVQQVEQLHVASGTTDCTPDDTETAAYHYDTVYGMWFPYLDYGEILAGKTADQFRDAVRQRFQQVADMGINTVYLHLRAFGDAYYQSALFPPAKEVGDYDPFSILLEEAHQLHLSVHGWVNPLRLQKDSAMAAMPDSYPVKQWYSDPQKNGTYLCKVGEYWWLNPAYPEVRQLVADGVAEILAQYHVDGIHLDDYFYPTTDPSIDAAQFAASGEADLTAWRRANVTRLVKAAHDAVKAADPTLRFGVSPQGNPDNDRNEQYTDLSVWLTASGADAVVDYLCPQIYWGYGYTLSSGSTRFAFENITAEWLALPRAESTALYFGLGAYRVGVGDGGANADSVSQWCTGSALARQVTDLRSAGAGGWALYRYGSLFRSDESGLAAAERAALTALDG